MVIRSITALPIHGFFKPDLAIISSLGQHIVGQYVRVKIEDDEGRIGLGEASVTSAWSGETQTGTIAIVEQEFKPLLEGADPFNLEWICRAMDRAVFCNSFAKAAIE